MDCTLGYGGRPIDGHWIGALFNCKTHDYSCFRGSQKNYGEMGLKGIIDSHQNDSDISLTNERPI